MSGSLQRGDKSLPALIVRPVRRVTVKNKLVKTARKKMFGHHLRRVRMVLQHARKMQLRPSETEIHRGFVFPFYELGQLVPRAEPRQNAISLPAPGNDLLARQ